MVKFNVTAEQAILIAQIARRAKAQRNKVLVRDLEKQIARLK